MDITYLIKVNVALLIFYVCYKLIAHKDTLFSARRYCLIGLYLFSIFYPFISFPPKVIHEFSVQSPVKYYMEGMTFLESHQIMDNSGVWNTANILLYFYISIAVLLLVRFFFQLISILRLKKGCIKRNHKDYILCLLEKETAPFSFFKSIFINPNLYTQHEYNEIITHERTHVKQLHSMDILLSEFVCCLFWCNPVVWLLKKEVRDNLEFLADHNVIKSGFNRKSYQYHLLNTCCHGVTEQLINRFNVPPLKNRISMMNKKRTTKLALAKYALLLPVTLCLTSFTGGKEPGSPGEITSFVQNDSEIVVKGNVKDENNKPLSGASIIIKGTSVGTMSDKDGNFSITLEKLPEVLVFSYVGKGNAEEYVDKLKKVNVVLRNTPVMLKNIQLKRHNPQEGEEVFVVVEEMPKFIGGDEGLRQYLSNSITYPQAVADQKIEGQVIVGFTVNGEGKPVKSKIIKSLHPELDKEALRVINNMPNWIPGKQRSKPANVDVELPIEFLIINQ